MCKSKLLCSIIASSVAWSWDGVLSFVTSLWAGWSGSQFPAAARDFVQDVQTGVHPSSYSLGTMFSAPGSDFPPSNAKVKNKQR